MRQSIKFFSLAVILWSCSKKNTTLVHFTLDSDLCENCLLVVDGIEVGNTLDTRQVLNFEKSNISQYITPHLALNPGKHKFRVFNEAGDSIINFDIEMNNRGGYTRTTDLDCSPGNYGRGKRMSVLDNNELWIHAWN